MIIAQETGVGQRGCYRHASKRGETLVFRLAQDYADAQQRAGVAPGEFRRVPNDAADNIVRCVEERFVKPSAYGTRWWWNGGFCSRGVGVYFKGPGFKRLPSLLPKSDLPLWLLINERTRLSATLNVATDETVLIYESTADSIRKVLDESVHIEYYLVPPTYAWLVCENHHNLFIALGYPAIKCLKQYAQAHPNELDTQNKAVITLPAGR